MHEQCKHLEWSNSKWMNNATFGVEQFKMQTFAGEDQTLINSVELCIHIINIYIYIYKLIKK